MKRLYFNVQVDRQGRPIWQTLQVTLRTTKEDRRYKQPARMKARRGGEPRVQ
jgi:hypothetical protein